MVDIPEPIKTECESKGGIEGLKKLLPADSLINIESQIFQALSDTVRLKIMFLLLEQPLCVCLLKEIIGISDSKLSYHLGILKDKDLIEGKRKGNWIIYNATELCGKARVNYHGLKSITLTHRK